MEQPLAKRVANGASDPPTSFSANVTGRSPPRGLTAHDAHYLALAESQRCECWTADERLRNTVKRELAWVRWIGEDGSAGRSG